MQTLQIILLSSLLDDPHGTAERSVSGFRRAIEFGSTTIAEEIRSVRGELSSTIVLFLSFPLLFLMAINVSYLSIR